MKLSERIKQLRLAQGKTLEYVGNIVGVGKSTVRKWESGQIKEIGHDKLVKLAIALETTPAFLIGCADEEGVFSTAGPDGYYYVYPKQKENTVRIAGRHGTFIERQLTDEQADLLRRMIEQMPEFED